MLDQMAFPPRAPPVIAPEEQRPSEGSISMIASRIGEGSSWVGRTTPLRRLNQSPVGGRRCRASSHVGRTTPLRRLNQYGAGVVFGTRIICRKNNAPPKAQSGLDRRAQ